MLNKNLPRSQGGSGIPDGRSELGQKMLSGAAAGSFYCPQAKQTTIRNLSHHGNPRKGDGASSHPTLGKPLGPPPHNSGFSADPDLKRSLPTSFSCFSEPPPGPSYSKEPAVKGQLPSRADGNPPANRKTDLVCFGESCKTSFHWGLKFLMS